MALRDKTNEELFKLYKDDLVLRLRNPKNLSDAVTMLGHFKEYLGELCSLSESIELHEGLSFGAVWCVSQVARELGIEEALEKDFQGNLRCGR